MMGIIVIIVVGLIIFYLVSEGSNNHESAQKEQERVLYELAEQKRIEKMNKISPRSRRCLGCKNGKIYNDNVEPPLFECNRREVNGIVEEKNGCPYYDPMLGSFIK